MTLEHPSTGTNETYQFPPTLEIRSVSKIFRTDVFKKPYKAVDQLSLTFHKGVCTGLLGHNGAGKTTTIRMILGLIQPQSGSIFFQGHQLKTEDKNFIGYMPEVNKLNLSLTVEETLFYALNIYKSEKSLTGKEKKEKIETKLYDLGLTPHSKKKVRQLSKGLARRLAFGQATIHSPQLLILDEPSTGLDPNAAELLIEQISEQKKKGTTIILCTHELVHMSHLCDHFYLMRQGKLVAQSLSFPPVPQVESIDWGSRFNIQVLTATQDQLEKLRYSDNLPHWHSIRTDSDSSTLSFNSYDEAAPWLSALLSYHFTINQFTTGHNLTSSQIQKFFRGQM